MQPLQVEREPTTLRNQWNGSWTEEREAFLRQLIAEKRSGGEIAAILRCTRNTIMGKAHRMGLRLQSYTHPKRPKIKARHHLPSMFERKQKVLLEVIEPDICDLGIPKEQRRTILTVTSGECRWPVGNVGDPDFFLCGAPCGDRPYCNRHTRIGTTNGSRY